jgi:cell division septal protein FtsQ
MEKNNKEKMTVVNKLKTLCLPLVFITALVMFIYGSFKWTNYIDLFALDSIEVRGCKILSSEDITSRGKIPSKQEIFDINITSIQNRIEEEPYVKAAIVSRQFPNRLVVVIQERIPICYLNDEELVLIDNECVILPLPKKPLDSCPPIISGPSNNQNKYKLGSTNSDSSINNIVHLINNLMYKAPKLYSQISEIYCKENGNITLFTTNGGTPIFLGKDNLEKRLSILANWQYQIENKRNLNDYQYIDLRWQKQIVTKEKS